MIFLQIVFSLFFQREAVRNQFQKLLPSMRTVPLPVGDVRRSKWSARTPRQTPPFPNPLSWTLPCPIWTRFWPVSALTDRDWSLLCQNAAAWSALIRIWTWNWSSNSWNQRWTTKEESKLNRVISVQNLGLMQWISKWSTKHKNWYTRCIILINKRQKE